MAEFWGIVLTYIFPTNPPSYLCFCKEALRRLDVDPYTRSQGGLRRACTNITNITSLAFSKGCFSSLMLVTHTILCGQTSDTQSTK